MMKEKLLRSVFATLLVVLVSCAGGPQITPCILSPESHLAECAPPGNGDVFEKQISEMSNYVCFSPDDIQALLEWAKRHSQKLSKKQVDFIIYQAQGNLQ